MYANLTLNLPKTCNVCEAKYVKLSQLIETLSPLENLYISTTKTVAPALNWFQKGFLLFLKQIDGMM